jgi:hypothetical protein
MRMAGAPRVRRWRQAALLLAAGAAAAAALAAADAAGAAGRVPLPALEAGAGERCVEDTAYMRRNHMDLLKHQRDRTVREGIRTTRHSLANCVTCHAGRKTGRVTGPDGFCQSCHGYAGVALDCFECHADRPQTALAAPGS